MLELLTGYHHPYPPRARGPVNSPHGSDDFPSEFVVCDLYGRPVPSFYTHGFPLRDVKTDVLLRDTVIRCLADKPADRPDLKELNDVIDYMERKDDWNAKYDWMDYGLYFQHPPKVCRSILPLTARTSPPENSRVFTSSCLQHHVNLEKVHYRS